MRKKVDFIAIDFETATGYRESICEVGICVVEGSEIKETRSWLVRPPANRYSRFNIAIHGIRPTDTEYAPDFDTVWEQIEREYLDRHDTFVAHNASFDRTCLERTAGLYGIHLPPLQWRCSLTTARRLYRLSCHKLGYLCEYFGIQEGKHHRAEDDAEMCARLYLQELEDIEHDK